MKFISTIVLLNLLSFTAWTQTHTPVSLPQTITNANSKGFYRYLPGDYNSTTKNYPLIIWVHGAGQIGQGNTADLPKILEWGVPKIISEGGFPASFRVNGVDHSFIIISPQFMGWPSAMNVSAIISYVTSNYRVDADRIYLMGISAGGGGIWDYASASVANSDKIAAMIPFCGTMSPTQTLAGRIAASKLPVWAFHNTHDGTVPVANSRNWVNYINNYVPAPSPAAKLTEFPVQSNNAVIAHECWSLATLPSYKPQGINIYEWMLQYTKRRSTETPNNPPVANAGPNASITLPANSVTVSGAASTDNDGSITSYRWRQVSGAAANIASSSSVQTGITFSTADTYRFELTVTDNRGGSATDAVDIYVSPAPGGGGGSGGGSSPAKTFRVNIFGGSNPYNNSQWNNWNIAGSLTSAKFNYDDGTVSNVNAVITASALIADNGATYANTATACPPAVLRYASANTSYRTLTLNGLTTTKTYNLEFYASRANTGNSTKFQIGNQSYTISTDNNLNNVARFTSIVPDNNGRISVIIDRVGTWNYLSGFIVSENAATSSDMVSARSATTLAPIAATAEKPVTEPEELVIYPNPGTDIIYLNLPAGVSGPYKLNLVNMNGTTVLQKTGTKRDAVFTDRINIRDLPKGMYLLKAWVQNKNMSSTIIKL